MTIRGWSVDLRIAQIELQWGGCRSIRDILVLGYGVRPRRDKRVVWVPTKVGRPPNNSASLPGRVHWRSVRGIGWP